MTTKVKQTEIYKDSQGEHIVCKGRLVLVSTGEHPTANGQLMIFHSEQYSRAGYKKGEISICLNYQTDIERGTWHQLKPIIISETEELEDGFDVYINKGIVRATAGNRASNLSILGGKKVLALPEYFSPNHLQAIVDGKLK